MAPTTEKQSRAPLRQSKTTSLEPLETPPKKIIWGDFRWFPKTSKRCPHKTHFGLVCLPRVPSGLGNRVPIRAVGHTQGVSFLTNPFLASSGRETKMDAGLLVLNEFRMQLGS